MSNIALNDVDVFDAPLLFAILLIEMLVRFPEKAL